MDSTSTKDWPLAPRTIRARGAIVLPQRDRVIMMLGSGVASYQLSTFLSSRIGQGLTQVTTRFTGASERWLAPDSYWYAESPTSGWRALGGDGQDRLYDIDADDRGLIYPACAVFGWGVLSDVGGLTSLSQKIDLDAVVPTEILSLRSGSSYYTLVANFLGQDKAILYDVTVPQSPGQGAVVSPALRPSRAWAKVTTPAGNNIVGTLDGSGRLRIYSAEGLINGTGPSATFNGNYAYVTSDGTNFYAAHGSVSGGMLISIFSPGVVGNASSYVENVVATGESMTPLRIRHGRGYLTVLGIAGSGVDMRVFRLQGSALTNVDLGGYFRNFYVSPPAGHVRPENYGGATDAIAYSDGTRDHIIFSGHGLGDVYELLGSGAPPTPIPPDPNISVTGCSVVNGACSVTARSISGASETGWTCRWTVAGGPIAGTACTISPGPFANPGAVPVGVTVTNSLGSSGANTILTIAAAPLPGNCTSPPPNFISVNLNGTSASCNNLSATCSAGEAINFFAGLFQGAFKDCDQFSWNFGDGSTSTLRNPTHTFAANGAYTVRLTVTNTVGSSTATPAVVTIGAGGPGPGPSPSCPAPARFVSVIVQGSSATCNNASAACGVSEVITFSPGLFQGVLNDCDQFNWNFGDGTTSTLRNATKQFAVAGTYTVRLTISNANGTSTATPATLVIGGGGPGPGPGPGPAPSCSPPARFVSVNVSGSSASCNTGGASCGAGESISFSPSVFQGNIQNCDQFNWEFGDGTSSNLRNPTKQYNTPGIYSVRVTLFNSSGSAPSSPLVLSIGGAGAKPVISDLALPAAVTAGAETTFAVVTSAPSVTASIWDFGDRSGLVTSSGATAKHTYSAAGQYSVSVVVVSAGGTSDPYLRIVTVRPPASSRHRGARR